MQHSVAYDPIGSMCRIVHNSKMLHICKTVCREGNCVRKAVTRSWGSGAGREGAGTES